MNCAPTLTAEEFKTIHNALWELDRVTQQLEDILKPDLYVKLARAAGTIREGLAGAYEQDDKAFSRKSRHYDSIKNELGLSHSEWSIYEVEDLGDRHLFQGATKVAYRDHWGDKQVECQINGLSWAALWVAANACVRDSGDAHHVYIEGFRPSQDRPEVLIMSTGS